MYFALFEQVKGDGDSGDRHAHQASVPNAVLLFTRIGPLLSRVSYRSYVQTRTHSLLFRLRHSSLPHSHYSMKTDATRDQNKSPLIMTPGIEADACPLFTGLAVDQEACREDDEKVSDEEWKKVYHKNLQALILDMYTTLAIVFQVFTCGFLICLVIHLFLICIIYISSGYSAVAIHSIRFTGEYDRKRIISDAVLVFINLLYPTVMYRVLHLKRTLALQHLSSSRCPF